MITILFILFLAYKTFLEKAKLGYPDLTPLLTLILLIIVLLILGGVYIW